MPAPAPPAGFLSPMKCNRIVKQHRKLQNKSPVYVIPQEAESQWKFYLSRAKNLTFTTKTSFCALYCRALRTTFKNRCRVQVHRFICAYIYVFCHQLSPAHPCCVWSSSSLPVTFWRRWHIWGYSQAQLHLNCWPIVSFAFQHSVLSSFIQHCSAPYWVLAASF